MCRYSRSLANGRFGNADYWANSATWDQTSRRPSSTELISSANGPKTTKSCGMIVPALSCRPKGSAKCSATSRRRGGSLPVHPHTRDDVVVDPDRILEFPVTKKPETPSPSATVRAVASPKRTPVMTGKLVKALYRSAMPSMTRLNSAWVRNMASSSAFQRPQFPC